MTTATADLGCALFVAGARVADTAADYLDGVPTALTGLQLTWGRSNPTDQPDAATCSFELQDVDGDQDYLALLHVGDPVDVFTESTAPNPTSDNVAQDAGFEQSTAQQRALWSAGGAVLNDSGRAYEGARALYFTSGPSTPVAIPPAPWGANGFAWDSVTPVRPGEQWTVRLKARAPVRAGTALGFSSGLFASPVKAWPTDSFATVHTTVDPGAWTTFAQDVTIPADAAGWLGISVQLAAWLWSNGAGTWAAQQGSWRDQNAVLLDALEVLAPATAVDRVQVFGGRITDLKAQAVGAAGAVGVSVICADRSVDLGNDVIGGQPYLEQSLAARAGAYQAAARTAFALRTDPRPGAYLVTWRDVDAQPVWPLLQELAVSADAVLWSAFNVTQGAYAWLEDVWARDSLATFNQDPGSGAITIVGRAAGVALSACDIARDAVEFTQDANNVATLVDVQWNEQTLDEGGLPAPTERHAVQVDPAGMDAWGTRRASLATQLSRQADADAVGGRLMARLALMQWHASGFAWDFANTRFDEETRQAALTMLDGTTRIGCPVVVTDCPPWVPGAPNISAYVDGGSYTFTDGRWLLDLNLIPSAATGESVRWRDLPTSYRWTDFDPAISWMNCWGVTADVGST